MIIILLGGVSNSSLISESSGAKSRGVLPLFDLKKCIRNILSFSPSCTKLRHNHNYACIFYFQTQSWEANSYPCVRAMSLLAPQVRRTFVISLSPRLTASNNAVEPSLLVAFTSTLCSDTKKKNHLYNNISVTPWMVHKIYQHSMTSATITLYTHFILLTTK